MQKNYGYQCTMRGINFFLRDAKVLLTQCLVDILKSLNTNKIIQPNTKIDDMKILRLLFKYYYLNN